MLLIILVTSLSILVALFYIKWLKVRSYWAERGVPFVPPNPFMGNLTFLQRKNPSIWMREVYTRYRAPYVGMWLFWRPALIINSPELARNVLVRDSGNFRNKFMTASSKDPIGALNLLFLKDPAWTNLRRRLTVAFTSAKLKSVQAVAVIKSHDLVTRIQNDGHNNISLRTMFADYTTDLFSITAFELASDATLTGEGAIRAITKDFMQFSAYRGISWCGIFFWPELADLFGLPFLPKESTDTLRNIFKIIFERKDVELNKEPRTLLDVLMQLKKKSEEDDNEDSEDFIIAQAAVLLIGGFDTSAATLTYVIYQLAYSPEVQEKLYQELLELKEKHGYQLDAIVAESTYMDCIIKEVLRIFPPMSWLDRVALEDYKVDEHLTIPAGMPIYVNGVGMQVDPQYYDDPYTFDPERFSAENEKNIPAYTYMPFGDGPRVCIGKRFAMIAMKNAMAAIILNYRVESCPGSPKPMDAEIEKRGLFLMPGEDLKVNFIPRK
ncbi:cytochrome P450 6k1-like [Aricia agestis]|uniref:cytochrome P450 6k1-like n=1 Tax=Aricia agestis TaxID=91739 RepID=UPI001C2036DE|nr:cytochrome P450 6k1-like [Aricia agestis]